MKVRGHYVAAAFCAFLSVIALIGSNGPTDTGSWRPAYFCFLPMCFFLIGGTTAELHREIKELRRDVDSLLMRGSGATSLSHEVAELRRRITELEERQVV